METYRQIEAVNLDAVTVASNNRSIPRKEQAALTRALFKRLGIKGISVTAPNYSMASSVDVRLPRAPRPSMAGFEQYENVTYSDMPNDCPVKVAMLERSSAARKVAAILSRAFPNHDDRSDYQTDYFDSCWSVD